MPWKLKFPLVGTLVSFNGNSRSLEGDVRSLRGN